MEFKTLKDSGKREDMETGSRRDTQENKSRPDLMNPLVSRRVGHHYANGCVKYGEKNFELGQKSSRYLASLERHLLDYKEGKKDEDHLAAIVWNANCLIMNQEFVERGIYDESIMDETNYQDKAGFDRTVGARARAHNDELRREELAEQMQEVRINGIKVSEMSKMAADNRHNHSLKWEERVTAVADERDDPIVTEEEEDFEEVPELPVCFGKCEGENDCHGCTDTDECLAHDCFHCDFDLECFERTLEPDDEPEEKKEDEPEPRSCNNCRFWAQPYRAFPCRTCIRNPHSDAVCPRDMWEEG
jgi:hypothetical protein